MFEGQGFYSNDTWNGSVTFYRFASPSEKYFRWAIVSYNIKTCHMLWSMLYVMLLIDWWCVNSVYLMDSAGHSLSNLGAIRWHLCLCLLLAWILVSIFLICGVRSAGKVMWPSVFMFNSDLDFFILTVSTVGGSSCESSNLAFTHVTVDNGYNWCFLHYKQTATK